MTWNPLVTIISPTTCERAVLRAQLLGADYDVITVHDPVEAIARLSDGIPHLIITDHGQAESVDSSFSQLMDRLDGASPLPVLYIMDQDEEESVPELLREGLDDTIMRPIQSLELLARTSSLLRNRQLLGQIQIQEQFLVEKGIEPVQNDSALPTVLLVEDETDEMENIVRLLQQIPCEILQARTPSDALWHVKHKIPQLVIVDLLFPDLDGLEFCRYLKKQEETRYTPLLMLTAVPELENRVEGMESGPDDYLVKPARNVEVLSRVRRLMDRNRGHQRLLGNNLLLNRHGFTDPSSGIPKEEFFRFVYPRMVNWSQRAHLPFTVARIRITSDVNFLKVAARIRSILRNFDLDFITGESDLSLILPETPSDRAQVALSRILAKAEDMGIPPWELRLVTISIGEEGWDADHIRETLRSRGQGMDEKEDTTGGWEKIVVATDNGDGENLAELLRSRGFGHVQNIPLDKERDPGKIKANLIILEGDPQSVPEILEHLLPSLSGNRIPVLVKYTGSVSDIYVSSVPETVDFIPSGLTDDYFIHRVRQSLDLAHLRSGNEEVQQFLTRLIRLLEEGDSDIQGHGQQVSNWAVAAGARLGLDNGQIDALRWGGLLHDVGKVFLPGKIVSKVGMLSPEEYTVVKSHARLGHDLCKTFSYLKDALPIIKHHHERMDGKGYPEGLKGEKIPLLARIVSVIDVYDTLIRRRPYRPAFSPEESARILRSEAEKGMWDRKIVDEFLRMIEQ
jgi:response regulator RpfG family c-di-GMP phosphodiesterase